MRKHTANERISRIEHDVSEALQIMARGVEVREDAAKKRQEEQHRKIVAYTQLAVRMANYFARPWYKRLFERRPR